MTIHFSGLRFRIGVVMAIIALLVLPGCGGGGGGEENTAPVADAASFTTGEDTPLSDVLSASDADGDPLTYSIVNDGTRGTVTITDPSTGAFRYVPDPDTNSSDTFSFKANDIS